MRFSRLRIRLAGLAILMLAVPREGTACSCQASGAPCQNAFQVDAVFAGTVTAITEIPDESAPPLRPGELRMPRGWRVEFASVTAYRGLQGASATVMTSGSGPSCGYAFKRGERYLVYATRNPESGGLSTGICSRTRLLADATEDLAFLRTMAMAGETRARIYGTIRHFERDLASGIGRDEGPMANVLVHVRGLSTSLDAWTDAQGRYEVTPPPGKYELTAMPPPGFSARSLQRTVELRAPRACVAVDFGLRFDGRISGTVRSSLGEPVRGVSVQVMAEQDAARSGNIQTLRAATDSSGRYEFDEVSPGRYVVGVDLIRRMDPEVVFPRTFYPGTPDAASATILELGGGERRALEPMVLPPARRASRLTGVVLFADGRPAVGAFISLRDGVESWRQVAIGIKVGPDGGFSFLVHEGLSYTAGASYRDEAQRTSLGGTSGPFVATWEMRPLIITLKSPASSVPSVAK